LGLALASVLYLGGRTAAPAEAAPQAEAALALRPVATVEDGPADIAVTDIVGDERLFVVEQPGRIRIVYRDGEVLSTPFLDISDQVLFGGEQGLLGLVFDPAYETNGYFYVNYTTLTDLSVRMSHISRFSVSKDPNLADPNSELVIFEIEQPFGNHNAGDLNFGPDGMFYFGLGDGGSGGDPDDRAQNLNDPLGKMLRIDVRGASAGNPYKIPADNPFVGDPGARGEIWALGLRNPWRFSFDRLTGDMYIGDVGQNKWEEVDFQPAGASGMNWGWRCYEGQEAYNLSGCAARDNYDFPVQVYGHDAGCAITGGYVYRGQAFPRLGGRYFFADYCSGRIWTLDKGSGWAVGLMGQIEGMNFTTFGQDRAGELFIASSSNNTIYQLVDDGDWQRLFIPAIESD